MSWQERRPVFLRLPVDGYQNNPVAEWLTRSVDEKLVATKERLENFYKETDPDLAASGSLDWLAYLVGFSGAFWDPTWTPTVKRNFIRNAHYLWSNRGTYGAILKAIQILGVNASIWTDSVLKLPFKLPGKFRENRLRFFIRIDYSVLRGSRAFKEAERVRDLYAPAVMDSRVCYRTFRLGLSKLGDPLFEVND